MLLLTSEILHYDRDYIKKVSFLLLNTDFHAEGEKMKMWIIRADKKSDRPTDPELVAVYLLEKLCQQASCLVVMCHINQITFY